MKNTLMYVLIAVALIALAYKLAYPAAPAPDMIAKVGDAANKIASGADNAANIAKQVAQDAANKVASGTDVAISGAAAAVSGAAAVVNTVVDATLGGSYTIASGSVVKWLGKKVGGSHPGQISISEGTVTVKAGKVEGGKLVIDMKTIKTLDSAGSGLDKHLSSADFFDVEKFPIGEFAINSVENGMINGDLILKGVTKEISFPGTVTVSGDTVSVKAKTNIERELWNISGGKGMVSEFFEIEFDVNFKK